MYLPGKLTVLPVENLIVHLGIYSGSFFVVKFLGQFSNTHYVDSGTWENIMCSRAVPYVLLHHHLDSLAAVDLSRVDWQ